MVAASLSRAAGKPLAATGFSFAIHSTISRMSRSAARNITGPPLFPGLEIAEYGNRLSPDNEAGRGGLARTGEPGVEVAPRRVDAPVVGLELDGDAGMGRLERGEPRQPPLLGHRLDRDDAHPPGGRALAFGDAVHLGEDALHLLQTGAAAAVEVDAAPPALEQLGVEMLLQGADAVADGGGGDPELVGGKGELWCRAAASKKRRQSKGGGGIANQGAGDRAVGGRYFVSSQIHLSQHASRESPAAAPFRPLACVSRGFSRGTWAGTLIKYYYS